MACPLSRSSLIPNTSSMEAQQTKPSWYRARARQKGDDLDWIQRIFWKAKIILAICKTLKECPLGVVVSLHG